MTLKKYLAACFGILLIGLPLQAQQAVLLGPDLEPQGVTLQSFSTDGIGVIDAEGMERTIPSDAVLRLTFGALRESWAEPDNVVATLRDGQVLVGRIIGAGSEDTIRLEITGGREAELSLDDLLSLSMRRDSAAPPAEDDDALLLATGETLVGFAESIGLDAIGFVVGDADEPIRIPLDRVRALSIANQPETVEPAPGRVRVRLTDDSSLLLEDAVLDPDRQVLLGRSTLAIEPAGLSVPMEQVMRVEPLSGRYTLSALADHGVRVLAGGEVFGVPMPMKIELDGAIRLHAPTTLGFDLPRGAGRLTLSAAIVLDDSLPQERRALAGCELVVYDGDEAVGGCTLGPDQRPQRLNLPLTGGRLRLELKPGVNGPVLDRVLLTDAEVLVGE